MGPNYARGLGPHILVGPSVFARKVRTPPICRDRIRSDSCQGYARLLAQLNNIRKPDGTAQRPNLFMLKLRDALTQVMMKDRKREAFVKPRTLNLEMISLPRLHLGFESWCSDSGISLNDMNFQAYDRAPLHLNDKPTVAYFED